MKCELCGAEVVRARTTGGEGVFDREQHRGGAWLMHQSNGYMFRRGSGPRMGYRVHACKGIAPTEEVAQLSRYQRGARAAEAARKLFDA